MELIKLSKSEAYYFGLVLELVATDKEPLKTLHWALKNCRFDGDTAVVRSKSDPRQWYRVNLELGLCECYASLNNRQQCFHIRVASLAARLRYWYTRDEAEHLSIEEREEALV